MNKQKNSGQKKNWKFHLQSINQFIQCDKLTEMEKDFKKYCLKTDLEDLLD